jgi:hypothetical protein
MANAVVVQLAVLSGLAVILICCLFVAYNRRKAHHELSQKVLSIQTVVEKSENVQAKPVQVPISLKVSQAELPAPPIITVEVGQKNEPVNTPVKAPAPVAAAEAPMVLHAALTSPEDRNQRILAGISENIRKSLIKPIPTYSPIQYPEKPRETEYVRVKKQIITPHGQIRFSILKDSISTNMLAVFRRASLDWKTPDDLIGFIPAYLEPEAEILNDQVLLVGTPGHNEKLAIPIRTVDSESTFRDCFDFVTDVRTATNTPAVLLASDTTLQIVSRGVITQPVFMKGVDRNHTKMKLLVEDSEEASTVIN